MEESSTRTRSGDGVLWLILAAAVIGILAMVWMGMKNPVQAPSTSVEQGTEATPTATMTPTGSVTPASNSTIDLKLKEVNQGGNDVDASFNDSAITIDQ